MALVSTAAFLLALTGASGMQCPGSGSFIHAGLSMVVEAAAPCDTVKGEIKARISGKNGWVDPHNAGVYTLLDEKDTELSTQRTTNPKTSIGGKVYTDKQIFTFKSTAPDRCEIEACSESQGMSVYDANTNYCDLHNLYCNDAVCKAISSFRTKETQVSPRVGSGGADPSKCVPAAAAEEEAIHV
mmetsp:Transcript_44544/g.81352  ORF Transcript_44544/g.81352 Transcript_44544/m.81352 type:complete len:185 (+) Transcript_44544:85-639(+)